jgi:hypothetical protein
MKQALISAPVLRLPDLTKAFELIADACECFPEVGAVLMQEGHPVAFYSHKLSGPELNCSASDIEMLAVVSTLKEWRCYLEGVTFTIVTNHNPNTSLSESTNLHTTKRRARWLGTSCAFDYEWQYRPGRINVADPISWAPQHFARPCGLMYALPQGMVQALPCACSICCAAYSLRPRLMRNPHTRGMPLCMMVTSTMVTSTMMGTFKTHAKDYNYANPKSLRFKGTPANHGELRFKPNCFLPL